MANVLAADTGVDTKVALSAIGSLGKRARKFAKPMPSILRDADSPKFAWLPSGHPVFKLQASDALEMAGVVSDQN